MPWNIMQGEQLALVFDDFITCVSAPWSDKIKMIMKAQMCSETEGKVKISLQVVGLLKISLRL